MWLATRHGFYSIVKKGGGVHVRARVEQDLRNLLRVARIRAQVRESPWNDYRWRAILSDRQLAKLFVALAEDLDYPNFKDEIGRRPDQASKLDAYHRLWAMMMQFQQGGEDDG